MPRQVVAQQVVVDAVLLAVLASVRVPVAARRPAAKAAMRLDLQQLRSM
jgi:hypothetical protein